MTDRRDFLKAAGVTAAALASDGILRGAFASPAVASSASAAGPAMDPATRALLMEALDAARRAGASYADIRIGRQRSSYIRTREDHVVSSGESDTLGAGVRALVDGRVAANQIVIAGGERDGRPMDEVRARSDTAGVTRFALSGAGKWYIKFIHMVPVSGDSVNYESKWATITFQVR